LARLRGRSGPVRGLGRARILALGFDVTIDELDYRGAAMRRCIDRLIASRKERL
jgi:hypothetical protein